jgi:hypothetical protein
LLLNQQEVIRLAFFEEKSQREISSITQTPLGTVKTRIELGVKSSLTPSADYGTRLYEFISPHCTNRNVSLALRNSLEELL